MTDNLVSASKFLSLILRHQPGLIGLELQAGGWVSVDALIGAANRHGKPLSRALLEEVVRSSDKQRFAFSPDGAMIRANQGHSYPVDLRFEQAIPPDLLFHGTARVFLPAILAEGLRRMQRHHVHLSATEDTALRVGQRHGAPVVLTIDAKAMVADGMAFYLSANGVWLTESVPPRYIAGGI